MSAAREALQLAEEALYAYLELQEKKKAWESNWYTTRDPSAYVAYDTAKSNFEYALKKWREHKEAEYKSEDFDALWNLKEGDSATKD